MLIPKAVRVDAYSRWCDFARKLGFLAVLILAAAMPLRADGPTWVGVVDSTAVTLPPSPNGGAAADASFALRAGLYLNTVACQQEDQFLHDLQVAQADTDSTWLKNGQNQTDHVLLAALAKVQWLQTHPGNGPCTGTFTGPGLNQLPLAQYTSAMAAAIPFLAGPCAANTGITFTPPPQPDVVQVSRACLTAEVNYALRAIRRGYALPGSGGLPCNLEEAGNVTGDWDMRMKVLIRILYLERQQTAANAGPILSMVVPTDYSLIFDVLTPLPSSEGSSGLTTRDYIMQQLITVDGAPGPAGYSWAGCGDNEYATGSPQDREDNRETGGTFWNDLGDVLSWLLRRLVAILVLVGIAGVLFALGAEALAVLAITTVLAVGLLLTTIPETENHRLMIESTRYLNNQLIIESLGADNAPAMVRLQAKVKSWLLGEFQHIAQADFSEYNARPYHQFSLESLRNLADFSTDADVRNGAEMLVEYSAAKFAVGSNQGRRQVPFRRHFAVVDCLDGRPCPDIDDKNATYTENKAFAPMFDDWVNLGDGDVAEGTLFLGLREQLPNSGTPPDSLVRYTLAAATVNRRPPAFIMDLGIDKSIPYLEKIHHAGVEIYSSSPSALITAGGIEAPHAQSVNVLGVDITSPDNRGAAVPTSIMFPSTAPRMPWTSLDQLFSFRGNYEQHGKDGTFMDNLCVWYGFACGTNLQVPQDAQACLVPASSSPASSHWLFFDSQNAACQDYAQSPHFYLAMYVICAAGTDCKSKMTVPVAVGPPSTAGFIEVVDVKDPPASSKFGISVHGRERAFANFQARVLGANPQNSNGEIPGLGAGCLSTGACNGDYHTYSRKDLNLNLRGHADDANSTGILSVDGVAETPVGSWPLAQGELIQSSGNGVITIVNPAMKLQVVLDFSDPTHPCHRATAASPCIQD